MYTIQEERLSPESYIDFLRRTDLGVVREWTGKGVGKALVRRLHVLAGGEELPESYLETYTAEHLCDVSVSGTGQSLWYLQAME